MAIFVGSWSCWSFWGKGYWIFPSIHCSEVAPIVVASNAWGGNGTPESVAPMRHRCERAGVGDSVSDFWWFFWGIWMDLDGHTNIIQIHIIHIISSTWGKFTQRVVVLINDKPWVSPTIPEPFQVPEMEVLCHFQTFPGLALTQICWVPLNLGIPNPQIMDVAN